MVQVIGIAQLLQSNSTNSSLINPNFFIDIQTSIQNQEIILFCIRSQSKDQIKIKYTDYVDGHYCCFDGACIRNSYISTSITISSYKTYKTEANDISGK